MNKVKKKIGRPKSDNPKDDDLHVRFTKAEYEALKHAARDLGYRNLSDFIRGIIFVAAKTVYEQSVEASKEKTHANTNSQ